MNVDINKLNDLEKLSLITLLWESIHNKENLPINDSHIRILLDREKTIEQFIPWEDVKRKLDDLLK